jgi:hypothetical protein
MRPGAQLAVLVLAAAGLSGSPNPIGPLAELRGRPQAESLPHSQAPPVLLDRVAATVGNDVITESEVVEEIRVTAFLNGEKPDLGPASRRAVAERLVDQQLLRDQMKLTGFEAPAGGEAARLLDELRRRYPNDVAFQRALSAGGITLDQLKAHLAWQVAVLSFTDFLFRPNIPAAPAGRTSAEPSVDQQLDAWLKQARSQTQIRFFKEAFQ